jgi:hypothetical protein
LGGRRGGIYCRLRHTRIMTELRCAEYIFVASDAEVDAFAVERPH